MPDALPLTGLYGKVPAHGDFVRRGLPTSFVGPWDAWLQDGMAMARETLGDRWASLWDGAPAWRFILPAGACGPDAVAGVLLPSEDMVGRRFPITLAALLAPGAVPPGPAWFAALEAAALAARDGRADADALAAAIPAPDAACEPGHDVMEPPLADAAAPQPPEPDPLAFFTAAPWAEAIPSAAWAPLASDLAGPPGDSVGEATVGAPLSMAAPEPLGDVGAAVADEPGDPGAQPADQADLLDLFGTAAAPGPVTGGEPPLTSDEVPQPGLSAPLPSMATPPEPDRMASDGTLAFLLGEAGLAGAQSGAVPEDPFAVLREGASSPPAAAEEEDDPLAALVAAGDTPLRAAPPAAGLPHGAPDPAPSVTVPDAADAATRPTAPQPAVPAEAPPAPIGGGWWTGGGGRLPASVRPWPALLAAADFASLLEADA